MTKRRKSSHTPRDGGGAERPSKRNRTPNASSGSGSETDVAELYKICVLNTDAKAKSDSVRLWEERGALSEVVWPFLLDGIAKDRIQPDELLRCCHLVVLFVSSHCRDGSFSSTVLSSLESEDVIAKVVETVLYETDENDLALQSKVVHFVIAALSSDNGLLQKVVVKHLTGIRIWQWMPERRRELELKKSAGLRRKFADSKNGKLWIVMIVERILSTLEDSKASDAQRPPNNKIFSPDSWNFLHRSLELMIDLLSVVATRLFLVTYLDAIHFIVRCRMSGIVESPQDDNNRLLQHLIRRIEKLISFPIDDTNHRHLSKVDVMSIYHARAAVLQKMCLRHYPHKLQHVIHAGVGLLCGRRQKNSFLERSFAGFATENLQELMYRMRLVDNNTKPVDRELMSRVLENYLSIPPYPMEQLKSFPLYPTESILWDKNVIPASSRELRASSVLALPKLDRQFLSHQDYLLRNFELVRLESAYEIRSDLVDVIRRVRPVLRQVNLDDVEVEQFKTEFNGWSRMAMELTKPVSIVEVLPPRLGETSSSQVTAEVVVDLKVCGDSIRAEWDSLREFDCLFLVALDASKMNGAPAPLLDDRVGGRQQMGASSERRVPDEEDSTFPQRYGVTAVRGCMIIHVRDDEGNILSDPANESLPSGTKRVIRVLLDAVQYSNDSNSPGGTGIYQQLNLVVRRHGRENNFKSVLETIRGLMQGAGSIGRVIPPWLQPLLLGYGDPNGASYKSDTVKNYATKTVGVNNPADFLDYGDTFVDEAHLREAVGGEVTVDGRNKLENCDSGENRVRYNYRVRMAETAARPGEKHFLMEAKSYQFPLGVPGNQVRFTPPQVEAIRSGLSPGLTLVVGPPGTGKTDVAVQIIASLYHSFPTQRTVIVTHSNAALNDIFQKVMARGDIEERYMVRLGSGEKSLQTDSEYDFTRIGRVAYSLQRRAVLLEEVQLMAESFNDSSKAERGADGSPAFTSGTADYFYKHRINKERRLFEKKLNEMEASSESDGMDVTSFFPFKKYFRLEETRITLREARGYISRVDSIFNELAEYRALELLRSQRQRSDYLILKQARIVAMTCTHAAIARSRLIELGFEYDNIVMEEAGQMLEIETFIPLLLQRGESDDSVAGLSRLKRICMMGDHNQLPPVVKNSAFSEFSNLQQSLFARLIRLGVDYIQFDRQGRARAELARLYSWRYNNLGDLSRVVESKRFKLANPGFAHTFQVINVEDFEGKGETTPTAYFYQNVGEAEYIVALFQYMVLIGYPPNSVSIITTYNGQKSLILDIIAQRCGPSSPFFGISPRTVSTVDQYQGQQNDIILLSLVRTEFVGHIRDVRRLLVAVSRARLGLYVFCRDKLFSSCHELRHILRQFDGKPKKLQLVIGEHFPSERELGDEMDGQNIFDVEDVAHLGSMVHSMQAKWAEAKTTEQLE